MVNSDTVLRIDSKIAGSKPALAINLPLLPPPPPYTHTFPGSNDLHLPETFSQFDRLRMPTFPSLHDCIYKRFKFAQLRIQTFQVCTVKYTNISSLHS